VKIAQFKTGGHDFTMISTDAAEVSVKYSGWVRLTEYIEVEFTPLPPVVVVEGQLKQLDAAEAELRTKFQEKLNELDNERAKLLSLTHEVQS
jgi:hypothetical protein